MVRALQLVLALGVAGLIGATLFAGLISVTPESTISDFGTTPLGGSEVTAKASIKTGQIASETMKSRNVGGGFVASPALSGGPLERVASRPQLTPPTKPRDDPTVPEKQYLRWRLVFNAIATFAGVLHSGDLALVLPGIDVVSADEACTTPAGGSWPCGMVARTAFRNYLQGRALNCRLPDSLPDKAIVAECLLQGQDPAAWLVERGWARSKLDSPLAGIAETARKLSRGIYGQPPAGVEVMSP